MKKKIPKTLVQAKHIEKGIEKYQGKPNPVIKKHLDNINWNYTPYLFSDGRVMLVYPDNSFAILYSSTESLYQDMDQEKNKSDKGLDNL